MSFPGTHLLDVREVLLWPAGCASVRGLRELFAADLESNQVLGSSIALPLSYSGIWSWQQESNPQHPECKSDALPSELYRHIPVHCQLKVFRASPLQKLVFFFTVPFRQRHSVIT